MGNEPGVTCEMGGKYLTTFVVYKATCRETKNYYVGSCQTTFKKRMEGHFNDVGKLAKYGTTSDSFARFFVKNFATPPLPPTIKKRDGLLNPTYPKSN